MADFQADDAINNPTDNALQYILPCTSSSTPFAGTRPRYSSHAQLTNGHSGRPWSESNVFISQPAPAASFHPIYTDAYESLATQYYNVYGALRIDAASGPQSNNQNLDVQKMPEMAEMANEEILTGVMKGVEPGLPIGPMSTPVFSLYPSHAQHPESSGHSTVTSGSPTNYDNTRGCIYYSTLATIPPQKGRQSSCGKAILSTPGDMDFGSKLEKSDSRGSSTANSTDGCDAGSVKFELGSKHKLTASAKASHSLVERKYRQNLNSKMDLLGQTIALSRHFRNDRDIDDKPTTSKLPKAEVLDRAMRYVQRAEIESEACMREIEFLRAKVAAYEKLVHCHNWVQAPFISTGVQPIGYCHQNLSTKF